MTDEAREQALENAMRHWRIAWNFMDDQGGRYFAVKTAVIDGESNAGATFDTLDAAAGWLALYDSEYPRDPAVVLDLETGERYRPAVEIDVALTKLAATDDRQLERDILEPAARRLLDLLGNGGDIAEWRPEMSGGNTIVVVYPDETAARIIVEPIDDPGPIETEGADR